MYKNLEGFTVLNLGAGERRTYDPPFLDWLESNKDIRVAVDIIEDGKPEWEDSNWEFIPSDALDFVKILDDKSFDIVVMLDALNCLTRKRGLQLLQELDRITSKMILITCMKGHIDLQKEFPHLLELPYNTHVSDWEPEDFTKLGYSIKTISGEKNYKVLICTKEI